MLAYVLLAGRAGNPLAGPLLDRLQEELPGELFFRPTGTLRWLNRSCTVAFLGWQLVGSVPPIGSHWHDDGATFTAFSGLIWPTAQRSQERRSWANWLARQLDDHPEAVGNLPGLHSVVRLAQRGLGWVASDPIGVTPLYTAESREVVAVANRAVLAGRAVAPAESRLARDVEGLGWLVAFGQMVGDRTGYEGVRVLAGEERVEVSDRGFVRFGRSPRPFLGPENQFDEGAVDARLREQLIESVATEIVDQVKAVAALPGDKSMALTGGRDSRLVLSAMVRANVQDSFRFFTMGPPASPDVVAAQAAAALVGVDHRVQSEIGADRPAGWIAERIRAQAFMSSGMHPGAELRGPVALGTTLLVDGLFGELFRAFYGKHHPLGSIDRLQGFFRERLVRPSEHRICHREVEERYLRWMDDIVVDLVEVTGDARDVLHLFYVDHRLHRWAGTASEMNALRPRAHPLLSMAGLTAAFRLGEPARRHQVLSFEIMRRTCEPLAKLPFAYERWPVEVYHGLPDASDYVSAAQGSFLGPRPGIRGATWEELRRLISDELIDDPTNPVFEVLDFGQIARIAGPGSPEPPRSVLTQLVNGVGMAVWLGRSEVVSRVGIGDSETPNLPDDPVGATTTHCS